MGMCTACVRPSVSAAFQRLKLKLLWLYNVSYIFETTRLKASFAFFPCLLFFSSVTRFAQGMVFQIHTPSAASRCRNTGQGSAQRKDCFKLLERSTIRLRQPTSKTAERSSPVAERCQMHRVQNFCPSAGLAALRTPQTRRARASCILTHTHVYINPGTRVPGAGQQGLGSGTSTLR